MISIEPAWVSAIVAAIALIFSIHSYNIARGLFTLTPSAKLWDRIYELDKLVIAHPEPFVRYMQEVSRQTPFFYADTKTVPHDAVYYQLKAIVYFHLNVFEEIYLTTESSGAIAKRFERDGWESYIFRKMRHPLIREVFRREADFIYGGKFNEFIRRNKAKIELPADKDAF